MHALWRTLRLHALILTLALTASGCLNLKPATDLTRYFVLAPIAPASQPSAPSSPGLALGVRIPVLPSYLEDKRLALRKNEHEIEFLQWSLWAESLDRSLARTMGGNLALHLATDSIRLFDWNRNEVQYELELVINRFEPDAQGLVTLDVSWNILQSSDRQTLRTGHAHLQKTGPPPTTHPEESVAGMSALLAELSQQLAAILRQSSNPAPGETGTVPAQPRP